MACPSGTCSSLPLLSSQGCLNGGGQIKPQKNENPKELLKRVEEIYNQQISTLPEQNTQVSSITFHFIIQIRQMNYLNFG